MKRTMMNFKVCIIKTVTELMRRNLTEILKCIEMGINLIK